MDIIVALQIPTYPIPIPADGASLGKMTWDLPEFINYEAKGLGSEVTATIYLSNPTAEDKSYAVGYYFLTPDGRIAAEGILTFNVGGIAAQIFNLPANAPKALYTTIAFSAPAYDYTFGLRMLLLNVVSTTATVVQETSRVAAMLCSADTYSKETPFSLTSLLPMPPTEGPPLPKMLGVYWPWYKKL